MAVTIDGSGIEFSGGGISLPLKYKDIDVGLYNASWIQSSAGKYRLMIGAVDSGHVIFSATICSWSSLRTTDNLIVAVNSNTVIDILSNTTSFINANSSVKIRILYI